MTQKSALRIGITGGMGCGKSIVSRIFHTLGIPVYDADSRAKWLMNHDPVLKDKIREAFGEESYSEDGSFNRNYITTYVFRDEEKVKQMNSLVHPQVGIDYKNWQQEYAASPYTLREAALLFEANVYKDLDAVIVVTAPLELRIQRILQRDPHRTEADTRSIIAKQMPEDEKARRADHLIKNDETKLIIPQVLELHALFTKRYLDS
ncbi:dephospho-CoA kinase [Xanthocytophaga agilis]|uniref:Dephospho-CoA kinase n=1 Tax=Xanthocytophaga agilis TaxID=3048010 RepID=A0AAE3UG40_9BACT|nr:dephospho-CoA kinase [Xanthocytophaga agilis]MDJ1503985.1 dephospho-CoA kinase [Xanthocytophaga agilis]